MVYSGISGAVLSYHYQSNNSLDSIKYLSINFLRYFVAIARLILLKISLDY